MALGTFTPYQRQKPAAAPTLGSNPMGQYQRRRQQNPLQPQAPAAPSFGLQTQQPLTQAGALAQQKTTQGLQTGNFAEVQSAQNATNRANALRQTQAIQLARGNAARGNLSAEAAQRAQDESLAAAQSQNLSAQNAVNALQRQSTQDAMNRADIYERDAYGRAADERDYQTGRADLGYNRATDEARYGDSRDDVMYGRGRQEMLDTRDESRYQDTRGDVQYGREYQASRDAVGDSRYNQEFAASRDDVMYGRGRDAVGDARYADETAYSRGRDTVGDQRYAQEYADARGDVLYGRDYQAGRDAVGDARYDQQYTDSRGDLAYTRGIDESRYADTRGDLAYNRATDESRYQDTRGDLAYNRATDESRYQDTRGDLTYAREYQASRDAVGDTRYADETAYDRSRDTVADQRYDQTYADQRGDVQYARETDASRYQDTRGDLTYAREEAKRLEGKGDVESLISSVQDPRAQNLLRTVQAQGGDVQAMYQQMMDNGTIKEDYRSASPGAQAYQAAFDEMKAMYPNRTDAEIQTMIQQDYETQRTPLNDATSTREQEAAAKTLAANPTQPNAGDLVSKLPATNPQAVPVKPAEVQAFLANNNTGGWVNLGGTPYRVTGASNVGGGEGNDFTIMQDQSGKEVYMLYDRTITDQRPAETQLAIPERTTSSGYYRGAAR